MLDSAFLKHAHSSLGAPKPLAKAAHFAHTTIERPAVPTSGLIVCMVYLVVDLL